VLRNFRQIVGGVKQLLESATLAEFRRNVAALETALFLKFRKFCEIARRGEPPGLVAGAFSTAGCVDSGTRPGVSAGGCTRGLVQVTAPRWEAYLGISHILGSRPQSSLAPHPQYSLPCAFLASWLGVSAEVGKGQSTCERARSEWPRWRGRLQAAEQR